jgi:hypothetical protein
VVRVVVDGAVAVLAVYKLALQSLIQTPFIQSQSVAAVLVVEEFQQKALMVLTPYLAEYLPHLLEVEVVLAMELV